MFCFFLKSLASQPDENLSSGVFVPAAGDQRPAGRAEWQHAVRAGRGAARMACGRAAMLLQFSVCYRRHLRNIFGCQPNFHAGYYCCIDHSPACAWSWNK